MTQLIFIHNTLPNKFHMWCTYRTCLVFKTAKGAQWTGTDCRGRGAFLKVWKNYFWPDTANCGPRRWKQRETAEQTKYNRALSVCAVLDSNLCTGHSKMDQGCLRQRCDNDVSIPRPQRSPWACESVCRSLGLQCWRSPRSSPASETAATFHTAAPCLQLHTHDHYKRCMSVNTGW